MVASPEDSLWLSPKWLVVGVALACDGMLLHYDMRLGTAASIVLGVAAAIWLYIALRYGSLSGATSGRAAQAARVRGHSDQRRAALERLGAQQAPQPPERP